MTYLDDIDPVLSKYSDDNCGYITHYHEERNHQGLENHLIRTEPWHAANDGTVDRRSRHSGMLNYYYCASA